MPSFTTQIYEFSHGKQPRGFAVWAFRDRCAPDINNVVFTPHAMTFAEAKKWARAALPEAMVIEVCP